MNLQNHQSFKALIVRFGCSGYKTVADLLNNCSIGALPQIDELKQMKLIQFMAI